MLYLQVKNWSRRQDNGEDREDKKNKTKQEHKIYGASGNLQNKK